MTRGAQRTTRKTGTFGSVDKRGSKYRARYFGPDGRRHTAPVMFLTKTDARKWLSLRQSEIVREEWLPPEAIAAQPAAAKLKLTLSVYANDWLENRDLKPRTREHYRMLLDDHILNTPLGGFPLISITPDDIRKWHAAMAGDGTPTLRAHAYGLLRTIMGTAASDGHISTNPCVIRGAGSAKRRITIKPASLPEIEKLAAAMPPNQQAMILLAAWCALRFGELTELRRKDIELIERTDKDDDGNDVDIREGVIRVRRAVVRVGDGFQVTTPKSDAGIRDVAIPPHLVPVVRDHLANHVATQRDALLFPAAHGGHLAPATLYRRFYAARDAAGRPDLRFHDLRHSGAVLAAATGATLAELMARLGHSTPAAAMRYQHAAQGRDKVIAAKLSELIGG